MSSFSESNGALTAGPLPLLDSLQDRPLGLSTYKGDPLFVDHVAGASAILIGRGREGWAFDDAGRGDAVQIATLRASPAAFEPAYFSKQRIDTWLQEADVLDLGRQCELLVKRAANEAGTSWQVMSWDFKAGLSDWSWQLGSSNTDGLGLERIHFSASVLGPEIIMTKPDLHAGDTYYSTPAGPNDHYRCFTWPWSSHGSKAGFGYGSTVSGVGGDDPNTFLWEQTNERHALPYTEVYLRKRHAPA